MGTKIGEDGFIDLTFFHRFHAFSQVGGLDRRVTDSNGVLRTNLSAAQQALYAGIPGFPYVNRINGDARSHLTNVQYNAGYDFGDVQLYSFGSYSKRIASAYENLRVPDRIIASPVLGVRRRRGQRPHDVHVLRARGAGSLRVRRRLRRSDRGTPLSPGGR